MPNSKRERYKKGLRELFGDDGNDKKIAYIPSPDEIRAACLLIQSNWSEEETESRMCKGSKVPVIYTCIGLHNGRPMGWRKTEP